MEIQAYRKISSDLLCDSEDHNDESGCSNPGCFRFVPWQNKSAIDINRHRDHNFDHDIESWSWDILHHAADHLLGETHSYSAVDMWWRSVPRKKAKE